MCVYILLYSISPILDDIYFHECTLVASILNLVFVFSTVLLSNTIAIISLIASHMLINLLYHVMVPAMCSLSCFKGHAHGIFETY